MILIAESGATKTDWMVCDGENVVERVQTHGISPNFMKPDEIISVIQNDFPDSKSFAEKHDIKKIFFYGTGCGSHGTNAIISQVLRQLFGEIESEINNDILASARALCQDKAGFICILGTGSNSCFYDGKAIIENKPAPGYILGDYGSGAFIGITFIKALLEEELPVDLLKLYEQEINHNYNTIIENVYRKTAPSKYLASMAAFVGKYRSHPKCKEIIHFAFQEFVSRTLLKYKVIQQYPIHFVGSIAHHFQEELEEVLTKNQLKLGKILQSPSFGLVAFHTKL
jgi:glucosamine kinase